MKTKLINRYYCDYCKKSGCSKGHMIKHEKHCTMNPNRECRMCELMELEQHPIDDLLKLIKPYIVVTRNVTTITEEGLAKLRDKVDDCPNCILATLRQARICVAASGFDYTKSRDDFWAIYNETLEDLMPRSYD